MRGLLPLREAHPKIQVELVVATAALDLVRREADLAIRLFRETSPTLVTKKIGDIGWSVYASKTYLEKRGIAPSEDPEHVLAGHTVVAFTGPPARSKGAVWLSERVRAEDVVLTGASVVSVLNAVKAGLGVSCLPCFAVEGDASLVRLTPAVVAQVEAFLVIPPDNRGTARVRVVMDAIEALFERERGVLEGTV